MSALSLHEPFSRAGTGHPMPPLLLTLSLCLGLGLGVQGLVMLGLAAQDSLPQAPRLLADAVRLLVLCGGTGLVLAIAAGLAKARGAVAAGLVLVSAPLVFLLARAVQIATLGGLTGADIHGATPWADAALHGAVFSLLAAALPVLAREGAGLKAPACLGAALGSVAFAVEWATLPGDAELLPRAIADIGVAASVALALSLAPRIGRRRG
jgi:hypothetical protein